MWHPAEPLPADYRGGVAAVTRPRGPLPRRVYWFRRFLVLGIACALVLGIAKLLDYSTGGSGGEKASVAAASPEPSTTSRGARAKDKRKAPQKDEKQAEKDDDKLARPDGPCEDGDVLVTPTITDAHAGDPVRIVLELTTVEADACFWEVSPETVFVNIDGEAGTLWSSQQCPAAVPTEQVVPRREKAAKVTMWWNGKESDEGCPSWGEWVLADSYTAVAAARGSVTPVATGFLLGGAVRPTVTTTPTPTESPSESPS